MPPHPLPPSSLKTNSSLTQEASPSVALGQTANAGLLLVYGAVGFFYLWRYLRLRMFPSLFIALTLPTGWVMVALLGLGIWQPPPSGWPQWGGALLGCLLLVSCLRLEIAGNPPKPEVDE